MNAAPGSDGHSATFPTALIEPRILSSCPPGGVVLDPFCGTGRTSPRQHSRADDRSVSRSPLTSPGRRAATPRPQGNNSPSRRRHERGSQRRRQRRMPRLRA
ncbi:DNA methyltransferase [Streptomyces sp. YS-3]|uniref:DNA methyltransferase n=1 Tax=Streptomyces sp. YS-3 TaxID=3381352 RepID=UPI0038628BA9